MANIFNIFYKKLQGDFTFTGLLEGQYDTLYTPENATKKVSDNII
jgi:hypothetical protein